MSGDQPSMTFTNTDSAIGVQGVSKGPVRVSLTGSPPQPAAPLPLERLLGAVREELRTARDREELDLDSFTDAEGLMERAMEAAQRAEAEGPEEADPAGARKTILRSLRQLRGLAEGITGVLAAVGAAHAAVQGIG